jgi:eukaryotic-like serine/threonine-protein kinase
MSDDAALISDRYKVDPNRLLPYGGAGLSAFAATDLRNPDAAMMALRVERRAPPRARALRALAEAAIDGMLLPLAHGRGPSAGGEAGYFIICHAPSGPPIGNAPSVWGETALIHLAVRPAARALEQLRLLGQTHRAIRPDNVFQSRPDRPITLGAAWASPPGLHQPALFEPPYSAACLPAGRGDGTIADDVYALGVLVVVLATGRLPLQGLDEAEIIRRKLALGCYGAIAGEYRFPGGLAELIHGMLAEDPEHRPTPAMLAEASLARGRVVATRPPRRAQRALHIAGTEVWDERGLADAIRRDPDGAIQVLTAGTGLGWLRRGVGDPNTAVRIEDIIRHQMEGGASGPDMPMMIIALLDPLAPLCWRGLALWPDGIGTAAAWLQHDGKAPVLAELIEADAVTTWSMVRGDNKAGAPPPRYDTRQARSLLRLPRPAGGMARLAYAMNPLMPCRSPLLADQWVVQAGQLLETWEVMAATRPATNLLDHDSAAFLGARAETRLDRWLSALGSPDDSATLALLHVLAEAQVRFAPRALPKLAAWAAERAAPLTAAWRNRTRRETVSARIAEVAAAGLIAPIVTLIDDPQGRAADLTEARQAEAEIDAIDRELARIDSGGPSRAARARQIGHEAATCLALAALAVMLVMASLG